MTAGARTHWLVRTGLAGLIVGAIDPLEGSILILPASALVALGIHRMRSRHRRLAAWGFLLLLLGFTVMWTITAIGGVGGSSGRSAWWATLVAPYIVGWVLVVVSGVRTLVDHHRRRASDRHGPAERRLRGSGTHRP